MSIYYVCLFALPYVAFLILTICLSISAAFFNADLPYFMNKSVGTNVLMHVSAFYSIITIATAIWKAKSVEISKVIVICIFPFLVILALHLQLCLPEVLFTNAALTCSLLMTYLFLQNRKISIDTLTGASNRTSLLKKLRNFHRYRGGGYLVIVSLDDFKFVNQTFGQENSDAILRVVANYLTQFIPDGVIYRYNGDEFALILTKQQCKDVKHIVNAILERFNVIWEYNRIIFMLSASIGVVPFPAQFISAEQLLSTADFTVYQAKASGKKRAVYFDDKLMLELNRRHNVKSALERAIIEDKFELYYQPIYNIKENRFEYAEALLRFTDEELGVIAPSEFIPIAEKSGLIGEITYIVFEKVTEIIEQMQAEQIPIKAVAVNLSAVNFMQKELTNKVISLMKSKSIEPSHIILELTEGILIDSLDGVKEVMNFFANNGVIFALDDFGAGYSNVSYLLNLPFHSVKLDRSIVNASANNYILLDSVITMLHKLGKKVVAEGVETQEQKELLQRLSCDYIQGYLYAKPMPKEEFIALLSNQKEVELSLK
ncbi:EAL domain-containing protein [Paludicola sp. MB14-C6]|uniref:putative bifunctional diguanylate cyclase/phosphodiesterase n=1 Tax=Paludihabitans sp. MB14-C6 TaxID=3070656 RepID=UPI0027DDCE9B|nr:GGDEF domain-containing phosphodiesterase [Paludicola sp. MB14-C6]WMJ23823.1 EAL domain-containing protein [Paludicola sp. MB14-C6]